MTSAAISAKVAAAPARSASMVGCLQGSPSIDNIRNKVNKAKNSSNSCSNGNSSNVICNYGSSGSSNRSSSDKNYNSSSEVSLVGRCAQGSLSNKPAPQQRKQPLITSKAALQVTNCGISGGSSNSNVICSYSSRGSSSNSSGSDSLSNKAAPRSALQATKQR